MKRLVLVRHAKAVPYGYEDDFSRDLADRGEKDAARVGSYLKELGITPRMMMSSPATRAMQTAMIFAEQLGYPEKQIRWVHDLYHGLTTDELIGLLREADDDLSTLFLFGHNPSIQFYAASLCRSFHYDVPTCATMIIDFDIETWKNLEARTGSLFRQIVPKEL